MAKINLIQNEEAKEESQIAMLNLIEQVHENKYVRGIMKETLDLVEENNVKMDSRKKVESLIESMVVNLIINGVIKLKKKKDD